MNPTSQDGMEDRTQERPGNDLASEYRMVIARLETLSAREGISFEMAEALDLSAEFCRLELAILQKVTTP